MSTTISMWLGIAFVGLGILAVLLQAWLWNPKYWDEVNKHTRAPKFGLFLHRWVGILFTVIYVALMIEMVPRLWEYQVELPARTVIHAAVAIVLGVLLFTKLAILRFFRHFEESMPALGYGILICTILLGVLSIPFALRAQGLGVNAFTPGNLERVAKLIAKIEFEDPIDHAALLTDKGLNRGRAVLVGDCVRCHDMRTILAQPRTASGWYKTVMRMTEKPSVFGEPTPRDDVPYVTAYLIAITPEIRESRALKAEEDRQRQQALVGLIDKLAGDAPRAEAGKDAPADAAAEGEEIVKIVEEDGGTAPEAAKAEEGKAEAAKTEDGKAEEGKAEVKAGGEGKVVSAEVDPKVGDELLQKHCTDCHELSPDITEYGGADIAGWTKVVSDMIEEGAEIPDASAKQIVLYLAQKYPKS